MNLLSQARQAVNASRVLATLTTSQKNEALLKIGEALLANTGEILAANAEDVERAQKAAHAPGINPEETSQKLAMIDRLMLNKERIESIVNELKKVVELEDEIGKIIDTREHSDGMTIQRVRVPLGVVGMIYESRPNVTVDAAILCLKSGNAVMLKGGSDAISSNRALIKVMKEALEAYAKVASESHSIPSEAIQFLDTTDRAVTGKFLKLKGYLDVIIPRGGRSLIDFVTENSMVPAINTGASVVHTYVDKEADLDKAAAIVVNAKTRRVSICNTLDTLLVHADVAEAFWGKVVPLLAEHSVEIRCDARALEMARRTGNEEMKTEKGAADGKRKGAADEAGENNRDHGAKIVPAQDNDFGKEFLDTILAVKIVDSVDEAIDHITKYSLKHSEAIVTENAHTAEKFLNRVDAACVYWNASTQYSDGAQFGLGAEIGISTQKLHVRGPFALEGLTSMKWVIRGKGQVRG